MDALPVTQRCLFCRWKWSGIAAEGREKALQHRLQAHPELVISRRRPGRHLNSFRQAKLKKEDWADVFAERDKRAWLLGIEIEDAVA